MRTTFLAGAFIVVSGVSARPLGLQATAQLANDANAAVNGANSRVAQAVVNANADVQLVQGQTGNVVSAAVNLGNTAQKIPVNNAVNAVPPQVTNVNNNVVQPLKGNTVLNAAHSTIQPFNGSGPVKLAANPGVNPDCDEDGNPTTPLVNINLGKPDPNSGLNVGQVAHVGLGGNDGPSVPAVTQVTTKTRSWADIVKLGKPAMKTNSIAAPAQPTVAQPYRPVVPIQAASVVQTAVHTYQPVAQAAKAIIGGPNYAGNNGQSGSNLYNGAHPAASALGNGAQAVQYDTQPLVKAVVGNEANPLLSAVIGGTQGNTAPLKQTVANGAQDAQPLVKAVVGGGSQGTAPLVSAVVGGATHNGQLNQAVDQDTQPLLKAVVGGGSAPLVSAIVGGATRNGQLNQAVDQDTQPLLKAVVGSGSAPLVSAVVGGATHNGQLNQAVDQDTQPLLKAVVGGGSAPLLSAVIGGATGNGNLNQAVDHDSQPLVKAVIGGASAPDGGSNNLNQAVNQGTYEAQPLLKAVIGGGAQGAAPLVSAVVGGASNGQLGQAVNQGANNAQPLLKAVVGGSGASPATPTYATFPQPGSQASGNLLDANLDLGLLGVDAHVGTQNGLNVDANVRVGGTNNPIVSQQFHPNTLAQQYASAVPVAPYYGDKLGELTGHQQSQNPGGNSYNPHSDSQNGNAVKLGQLPSQAAYSHNAQGHNNGARPTPAGDYLLPYGLSSEDYQSAIHHATAGFPAQVTGLRGVPVNYNPANDANIDNLAKQIASAYQSDLDRAYKSDLDRAQADLASHTSKIAQVYKTVTDYFKGSAQPTSASSTGKHGADVKLGHHNAATVHEPTYTHNAQPMPSATYVYAVPAYNPGQQNSNAKLGHYVDGAGNSILPAGAYPTDGSRGQILPSGGHTISPAGAYQTDGSRGQIFPGQTEPTKLGNYVPVGGAYQPATNGNQFPSSNQGDDGSLANAVRPSQSIDYASGNNLLDAELNLGSLLGVEAHVGNDLSVNAAANVGGQRYTVQSTNVLTNFAQPTGIANLAQGRPFASTGGSVANLAQGQPQGLGSNGNNVANLVQSQPLGSTGSSVPSQLSDLSGTDCATGYIMDPITGSCEKSFGQPGAPDLSGQRQKIQPIAPKGSECPVDYTKHPYLPLCYPSNVDLPTELGISGPHHPVSVEGACPGNLKLHPYLSGVCINPSVQFDLDLGKGIQHPDLYGNCLSNWRRHATLHNLCLDTTLDLDLGDSRIGRLLNGDSRCRAGWRQHPDVSDLCVDSATNLAAFHDDRATHADGSCDAGYVVHPVVSDLCIPAKTASTIPQACK